MAYHVFRDIDRHMGLAIMNSNGHRDHLRKDHGSTRPGFNHAAVATICRKVEGIPLAIELAAARVRVLSVEELAERLDDRLGERAVRSHLATALPATVGMDGAGRSRS